MRPSERAAMVVLLLVGCGADAASEPDAGADAEAAAGTPDGGADAAPTTAAIRLADVVHDAPGATGTGYGDPMRAVNGVRGGGNGNGSLDVYSLGYADNATITLAWSGEGVAANGDGDDLAVFENPFATGGGVFMDLAIVEVSRDGTTWRPLAHDYTNADETVYVDAPAAWTGFAGRAPVLLHADTNSVDPFDRTAAGGDGFDLDDVVGDDAEAAALRTGGARYVRIVSAPSRSNPDTAALYVRAAVSNGADLDGIYGRYVAAE